MLFDLSNCISWIGAQLCVTYCLTAGVLSPTTERSIDALSLLTATVFIPAEPISDQESGVIVVMVYNGDDEELILQTPAVVDYWAPSAANSSDSSKRDIVSVHVRVTVPKSQEFADPLIGSDRLSAIGIPAKGSVPIVARIPRMDAGTAEIEVTLLDGANKVLQSRQFKLAIAKADSRRGDPHRP